MTVMPTIPFQVGTCSAQGRRHTMEDAHCIVEDFGGISGQGYFAVFDGFGGVNAAVRCKEELHEILLEQLQNQDISDIENVMTKSFLKLDSLEVPEEMHCGSCVATAYLRIEDEHGKQSRISELNDYRRVLYTANVGDTRAVLSRNGTAQRLTYDHKVNDLSERSRIKAEGGIICPRRSGARTYRLFYSGGPALSRAIGFHSLKEWIIGDPHVERTVLTEYDEFLIIACDGVWDVITDQDAVDLLWNINNAQEASERLLQYALDNGSTDNVTAIVIRFSAR